MALGGLRIEPLPDENRKAASLSADSLALLVSNVGQYGMHGAAKQAGFQKGDIIVEIDGLKKPLTEGQLIDHLLEKHFPGEKVSVTVLRGAGKKTLELPMQ